MFYRVSTAIIAPDLASDLQLNSEELGLLGAVFFYVFALFQLPLGPILDRAGARATMIVLNILGFTGTLLFAQSSGLFWGALGRGLMGLGMAANLMGTLKIFSRWFDLRQFATLTGTVLSIGTLGSLAATSPLALLVEGLGWRHAFWVLAGLHLLLTLMLFLFVRDEPMNPRAPRDTVLSRPLSPLTRMKTLFGSWDYWAISWSIFLRYGSFAAIQALWAGPFLMEYVGVSTVTAGNILLMLSIGVIVGGPVSGMLSDRIFRSRKRALISGFALAALGVLLLSFWPPHFFLPLLGALFFVIGFSNAFGMISYSHIRELMPEDMSGTAMTGINFFTMMGGGVFVHALGGVMKRLAPAGMDPGEPYRIAFLICFGALLTGVLLYATTRDSHAVPR
jgi:MFS family permease